MPAVSNQPGRTTNCVPVPVFVHTIAAWVFLFVEDNHSVSFHIDRSYNKHGLAGVVSHKGILVIGTIDSIIV